MKYNSGPSFDYNCVDLVLNAMTRAQTLMTSIVLLHSFTLQSTCMCGQCIE